MSQYTELIQIVDLISIDAENAVIGTLEYADQLGRFNSVFSSTVNGTNDLSAKKVSLAFMSAQKALYNASKYLIEASKAGHEWCGDSSPVHVLKKTKR